MTLDYDPLQDPIITGGAGMLVAVVGLLIGSFLNVVAWRVPRGESIAYPPSHCPRCGAAIEATDNVPVLSWLLLGGRCRVCRGPISARYPVVETANAALWMVFYVHDGLVPLLPFHLALASLLLALSLIDLDTWLLPLTLSVPVIVLGLGASEFRPAVGFVHAAIGAAVGYAMIVIIGWVAERAMGKEAMGGGDAWLMAGIGAFTGAGMLLFVMFLASVQGLAIGLWMVKRRAAREAVLPKPMEPPAPPPETPVQAAVEPAAEPAPSSEPQPVPELALPAASPLVEAALVEAALVEAKGVEASDEDEDEDEEWVPDPSAIPFGPFLSLAAIETLVLGQLITRLLRLDDLMSIFT